jgi:hypothetical protein
LGVDVGETSGGKRAARRRSPIPSRWLLSGDFNQRTVPSNLNACAFRGEDSEFIEEHSCEPRRTPSRKRNLIAFPGSARPGVPFDFYLLTFDFCLSPRPACSPGAHELEKHDYSGIQEINNQQFPRKIGNLILLE